MPLEFLQKLRERKLVQWGLSYLAGAWVLLQVLGQVGQSFEWPLASMRMITAGLGVGLFPVLVLAYYHGERGQQRVTGSEVLALLVVIATGAGIVWTVGRTEAGAAQAGRPAAGSRQSLAVLPFASLSADPENIYFASGIHDELLTQLSKLGGVKVISRTSVLRYAGTTKPIREVARELGVGVILEGSVQRAENRVRVQAQLIDAATDEHLWADRYDRDLRDVLGIQAEIAQQIAAALNARLSPAASTQLAQVRARTIDPRMYEVYLRGRYEAGAGNHKAAIAHYNRALAADSAYGPTYAALARSYYSLGFFGELAPAEAFVPMRQAAARALEIDPSLADAHGTLALFYLHREWDWKAADRQFRRALELSPNDAQVRHDYAHYLLAVGRIRASVEESSRAAEIDPANTMLKACRGWHDFTDREYDNAVNQATSALMMMPGSFWPEIILGWAYEHKGQHGEAISALRSAVAHSNGSPLAIAALAHAHADAGERTPARHLLGVLVEKSRHGYVSAYDMAVVHSALGDREEALSWLGRAFSERSAMLVNIGWDPRFDRLRGDPRFQAIVAGMKLPARPAPRRNNAPSRTPAVRSM